MFILQNKSLRDEGALYLRDPEFALRSSPSSAPPRGDLGGEAMGDVKSGL